LTRKDEIANRRRKERQMKRYVVNEAESVKGKLPVPGGGVLSPSSLMKKFPALSISHCS
jgi:hypothetical protein